MALDTVLNGLGFSVRRYSASDLALSDGASVSSWTEHFGNTAAVQATSTKQPTFKTDSLMGTGLNAIRFDGTSDLMTVNSLASSWFGGLHREHTIFLVAAPSVSGGLIIGAGRSSSTNANLQYSLGSMFRRGDSNEATTIDVSQPDVGTNPGTNIPRIRTFRHRRRENSAWTNGTAMVDAYPSVISTLTLDRFAIGGLIRTTESSWWAGDISEVIIVQGGLTDSQIDSVEAELSTMYSISVVTRPVNQEDLIPNFVGTTQQTPAAVVDGENIYVVGVRPDGMLGIAKMGPNPDRASLVKWNPDDHDSPAFLNPPGKIPIIFFNSHNTGGAAGLHWRRGIAEHNYLEWEARQLRAITGVTSYVQAHYMGGDNALVFTRVGNYEWHFLRSSNWGTSFGTSQPLITFGIGNQGYLFTTIVGNTIRCATYGHAHLSNIQEVRYFEIDITTEDVKSVDGTVLGNLDGTNLPLTQDLLDLVYAPPDEDGTSGVSGVAATEEIQLVGSIRETISSTAELTHFKYDDVEGGWINNPIATAGDQDDYYYGASLMGGGVTWEPGEEAIIYGRGWNDGTWTIDRFTTPDGGETWEFENLATSPAGIIWRMTVPLAGTIKWPTKEITAWTDFNTFQGNTRLLTVDVDVSSPQRVKVGSDFVNTTTHSKSGSSFVDSEVSVL